MHRQANIYIDIQSKQVASMRILMFTSLFAVASRVSDLAGTLDLSAAQHTAVVLVAAARAPLTPTRPVPVVAQRAGLAGEAGVTSGTPALLRAHNQWPAGHL